MSQGVVRDFLKLRIAWEYYGLREFRESRECLKKKKWNKKIIAKILFFFFFPTFLQLLRKLNFYGGGIVLYSPGRRKSRDYSVRRLEFITTRSKKREDGGLRRRKGRRRSS